MNDNPNRKSDGTNADDLLGLLNKYDKQNNAALPEETAGKAPTPKAGFGGHFGADSKADTENTAEEPGKPVAFAFDAHLSDTVPAELAPMLDKSATVIPEKPAETEPELPPEEEKKPWYIRILLGIGNFFWNSGFLIKAAVYVAVVLVLSVFLSYYAITIGNDVFAFVKSDHHASITVPEDATAKEVAYLLEKNGIIEYPWVFELYMLYKDKQDGDFLAGEHSISSSMNYSQIIYELTEEPYVLTEVSITIPEGYTTDQIIDLFVSNGIGTREGFVEAINNYPYKHEFVRELEKLGYSENRTYRLDGYLYPDTYYFYTETEEYLVINKLLNNFQTRFWQYYETVFKEDIEKLGMTFDDIITVASLIQSEAKLDLDFEYISFVFHNRLSHPDTFPCLESDATIQYFLGERTEDLTAEQLKTDNPYNTYIIKGLTPGAICSPGYDAISAAIYPDAPLDDEGKAMNAYFFVTNKANKTYYAATLSQHNKNKNQVKLDNEALKDSE